ncbi:hypothetical protein [Peptostreptococcus equinus]|uniref:DUF4375 domain-containing protein n=1 Tax=Peptostreptococcus equinus TaxID=3003601 RepID=A0ABY7JS47_9FIRM|nr:hypothetical protein [Peptostreptococcus sp. CBA3647]WAW14762.1 hypothetical protein O0R46_09280 [Peptostreptococcus sp. CBA3647]
MNQSRIEEAKMSFKNHKATLIQNTDRYTIIDWKNEDGSNNYYINFIIDKLRGNFIISGDLGDCIATWYNKLNIKNLKAYIKSIDYFISKFRCASNCYTYDYETLLDDLLKQYDMNIEDIEDIKYYMSDCYLNHKSGLIPSGEVVDILGKYDSDWWETFDYFGRDVDFRIFLWIVGFNMACEQLGL